MGVVGGVARNSTDGALVEGRGAHRHVVLDGVHVGPLAGGACEGEGEGSQSAEQCSHRLVS